MSSRKIGMEIDDKNREIKTASKKNCRMTTKPNIAEISQIRYV